MLGGTVQALVTDLKTLINHSQCLYPSLYQITIYVFLKLKCFIEKKKLFKL